MQNPADFPARFFRLTFLAGLVGLLAGLAATVFLYLLDLATQTRESIPAWILALPFFGFFVGWLYHRFGGRAGRGHHLLLDEIHEPRETIPLRMAPLVLLGTVLTHLGGGSAGREGTAVQMAGSLAAYVARFFHVPEADRRALLIAGLGAGFGGAVGAPLAGVVFGLEVITAGGWVKFRSHAWWPSLAAGAVAYLTAHVLHAPHSVYPAPALGPFAVSSFLLVGAAGLAFGLAARIFTWLAHRVEKDIARLPYPPLRPFFGGILLTVFFWVTGAYRYAGLGIPVIQDALNFPALAADPILKIALTALTVGSGFKGGEFIPLVFIGTTLGSALAFALGLPLPLFAGVGFSAVFGAAAKTPLACAIMAAELLGAQFLPYALFGGFIAYLVAGPRSVYPAQRNGRG